MVFVTLANGKGFTSDPTESFDVIETIYPSISGFGISTNELTENGKITVSGTISGNGENIKTVQVSIFNEDGSKGGSIYRKDNVNAKTFSLSNVPAITMSTTAGSTNMKLEAGKTYKVVVFVTLANGKGFTNNPTESFDVIQKEVSEKVDLIWPCESAYTVTCLYYYKTGDKHSTSYGYKNAMDIAGGGNILAAEAGKVVTAKDLGDTSFGKYVVIEHADGSKTLYAHLKSYSVKEGDSVKQGQIIGVMGSSGNSSGVHLHFEYSAGDPWKDFYNAEYAENIIFEQNVRSNNDSYNSDKTVVEVIDSYYKKEGSYYYYKGNTAPSGIITKNDPCTYENIYLAICQILERKNDGYDENAGVACSDKKGWYTDEFLYLVMATAWTESSWQHYSSNGQVKISTNSDNTKDIGIMQLNDKVLRNASGDWLVDAVTNDWVYNLEYGMGSIWAAYREAKNKFDDEISCARGAYSRYNGGSAAGVTRWRDNPIAQDNNFYRNYTNAPWQNYVDSQTPTKPTDSAAPLIDAIKLSSSKISENAELTISTAASDNLDLKSIQLFVDDKLVKEWSVKGTYTKISHTVSGYSVGSYTVRVVAIDQSGNQNSVETMFTVEKKQPDPEGQKRPTIYKFIDEYSVYMGEDVPLTGVVQTVEGGLLKKITIKYNKVGLSNNTVVTIDLSKQQMTQFDLANFKISTNKADIFAEPGVYEMVIYASASNYTVKDNCIGSFTVTVLPSTIKAVVKNNGIKSVSANVLELSGVIESYGNGFFISCGFEIYNSNQMRIKSINLPRPVNNTQTIRTQVHDLTPGETYYYCTFLETSEGVFTSELVEFEISKYAKALFVEFDTKNMCDSMYINSFFDIKIKITPNDVTTKQIDWTCDNPNVQLIPNNDNSTVCQIVAVKEGTYTIKVVVHNYDGTSVSETLSLDFRKSVTFDSNCLEFDYPMKDVVYSDELFAQPATEYNHNLTKFAISAALAAFTGNTKATGDLDIGSTLYNVRIGNIKELYDNIGIDDVTYYNYEVALTDSSHKVAFSIAKKEAIINGEKCIILFSIQRGGGYGAEWASNFCIGASGDAEGFAGAADKVYDQIAATLNALSADERKCNVKIFLTGFSRGAAVTNLIAAKLDREIAQTTGLNITNEDIYAYTFATPQGTVNKNAHDNLYDNIFNIVNPGDVVPMVAMSDWEFTRYGRTLEFPILSDFLTSNIFDWIESEKINSIVSNKFSEYKKESFDASDNTQFHVASENLVDIIVMFAQNREEFADLLQKVIYDILAPVMGQSEKLDIAKVDNLIMDYLNKRYTPNEIALANQRAFECLDWDLYYIALPVLASVLKESTEDTDNLLQVITIVIELHKPNGAKTFYSDLWTVLCADFDDSFLGIVSPTADQIRAVLQSETVQAVISTLLYGKGQLGVAHYPANYAAWVNAFSHEQFLALCYDGRLIHTIACPVDVYVYDPTGNIVASVVNDELISNNGFNLIIKVDGDVKTISYPDNIDYRVEIVPRSSGTMSVYVSSQNANGTMEQTAFENIILDVNGEYRIETFVNEDGSKTYELTNQNDNAFEGVTTEQKVVKISTEVIGNGYVSGAGQTFSGLYCTLTANPANGEEFIGWYVGDTLISEDPIYRFFAEKSITYVAKFTQKSNENDSEGEDTTTPSNPSDTVTPDNPETGPNKPDNDSDVTDFIDSIADKVGVSSDQLLILAGGSLAALVLLIIVIVVIKRKRR